MNTQLWNRILEFDFDSPPAEYGFSTRLAKENYWTRQFTQEAVLEYRKFMYLAATSDMMVSPSETVDAVWHQHLVFTQSYQEFCAILGKQVQHIPSTRNKSEAEKFRAAKERTNILYTETFGAQPGNIWEYKTMYDSLHLAKARWKIRSFALAGLLVFAVLTIPFYFLLKPLYVNIDNPYFIFGYLLLIIITFVVLELYNRWRLQQIISEAGVNSFIHYLHPFELVYLKTQALRNVVNGVVNELIDGGAIVVNEDHSLQMSGKGSTNSVEQLQAMNVLHQAGRQHYPAILRSLRTKPVFTTIASTMDAFRKYFIKSGKFGRLFYLNFSLLLLVLMFGFTRMMTGMMRDKPVVFIVLTVAVLSIAIAIFLARLTNQVATQTVPQLYRKKLLQEKDMENDWQWSYFLLGSTVLASSFVPVTRYVERNASADGLSSTASACGSSCGSSCGGCGGCGGS